jgi:hypothetical protein
MGLMQRRMDGGDASFFWQLLTQIGNPMDWYQCNPRLGSFTDVTEPSNVYTIGFTKQGKTCEHIFQPGIAQELVN